MGMEEKKIKTATAEQAKVVRRAQKAISKEKTKNKERAKAEEGMEEKMKIKTATAEKAKVLRRAQKAVSREKKKAARVAAKRQATKVAIAKKVYHAFRRKIRKMRRSKQRAVAKAEA